MIFNKYILSKLNDNTDSYSKEDDDFGGLA